MATVAVKSEYGMFMEQLAAADERLLILDYDGTLAPFTSERSKASPYNGVPELLNKIGKTCGTRVVIVTGRSAHEIPKLLKLDYRPEIWGVYGIERMHPDGREEIGFLPAAGLKAIAEADSWFEKVGLGDRSDLKLGAVALHWRGLPERKVEEIRAKCYSKMAQLACAANLILSEFDGGLELRLGSCDKAHAVQAVLAEIKEDVPVAFLGDDSSDEAAFVALKPRGLTVLVRPIPRSTAAQVWLQPPHQLISFFEEWISACGGAR